MPETKLKITQQQGNTLLMAATNFIMPEKLGDTAYPVVERGLAQREVGELFRELKARSPLMHTQRKYAFGPPDNWDMLTGETMAKLKDPDHEVEIGLSDDALSGAYWCLLLMLHPASQMKLPASAEQEVLWPLAARLRLTQMLKKQIGLDKAQSRRLELDPEKQES